MVENVLFVPDLCFEVTSETNGFLDCPAVNASSLPWMKPVHTGTPWALYKFLSWLFKWTENHLKWVLGLIKNYFCWSEIFS